MLSSVGVVVACNNVLRTSDRDAGFHVFRTTPPESMCSPPGGRFLCRVVVIVICYLLCGYKSAEVSAGTRSPVWAAQWPQATANIAQKRVMCVAERAGCMASRLSHGYNTNIFVFRSATWRQITIVQLSSWISVQTVCTEMRHLLSKFCLYCSTFLCKK